MNVLFPPPPNCARAEQEAGKLLIELSLVIGALVFLLLGSLEFSRYLRQKQIIQTINREAASLAFRDCSTRSGTNAALCLQHIRDLVTTRTASLVPNKQIIISLYVLGPGNSIRLEASTPGSLSFSSRYSVASLSGLTDKCGEVVRKHGVAIISELQTPDSPFSGYSKLVGLASTVYDSSIL